MELPEIAKRMGRIEAERTIYMEDYVLTYLQNFKNKRTENDMRIILYGRKEENGFGETYTIYGAADNGKEFFKEYDEIGCLNLELWQSTESMCDGILLGDGSGGKPIPGYYIFYDEAQAMKEYMGHCYEEDIYRNLYKRNRLTETVTEHKQNKHIYEGQAELVALSNNTAEEESPLYSFIRAAVIVIFIVFCAIAVTTVNSYEKMEDFTQAAEQMNESLEQSQ